MLKIADPFDALPSFEKAVKLGEIFPQKCQIHPEMVVLVDDANGEVRFTFALMSHGRVKATVAYLAAEPFKGEYCFQVGYAVAIKFRGQGIATEIFRKSVDEMRHLCTGKLKHFYIEAVVGVENIASRRVAEKVLAESFEEINDKASGLPAVQYMRLISNE